MLDILMPVSVDEIPHAFTLFEDVTLGHLASGAIHELAQHTDVPFRLVVCVDGGTREDIEGLRAYLESMDFEWSLMQNDGVLGYEATVAELIAAIRNDWVAVVPPTVWVEDPQWFGKMQVVFTKDPHCFLVAGDVPNTVSATAPPFKLDHRRHPKSNFFLSRAISMRQIAQFSGSEDFSRKAHTAGGTRWVAGGVRYGEAHDSAIDR